MPLARRNARRHEEGTGPNRGRRAPSLRLTGLTAVFLSILFLFTAVPHEHGSLHLESDCPLCLAAGHQGAEPATVPEGAALPACSDATVAGISDRPAAPSFSHRFPPLRGPPAVSLS